MKSILGWQLPGVQKLRHMDGRRLFRRVAQARAVGKHHEVVEIIERIGRVGFFRALDIAVEIGAGVRRKR